MVVDWLDVGPRCLSITFYIDEEHMYGLCFWDYEIPKVPEIRKIDATEENDDESLVSREGEEEESTEQQPGISRWLVETGEDVFDELWAMVNEYGDYRLKGFRRILLLK